MKEGRGAKIMLPCQGNFCNLGAVSTLPLWDHDRKGEWRDCVEVGKEDDTETSLSHSSTRSERFPCEDEYRSTNGTTQLCAKGCGAQG